MQSFATERTSDSAYLKVGLRRWWAVRFGCPVSDDVIGSYRAARPDVKIERVEIAQDELRAMARRIMSAM